MTTRSLNEIQIDDERIEIVEDYTFLGSRINKDGDCSHEINRRLMLGRQAMINLEKLMKSRDINMNTKKKIVQTMVFPITTYGCESWTIKKQDRRKVDAFELWCWRRVLRVPWTAKRTNQSILDEIKPDISLESSMLKLKLSFFGHIMRKNESLEKEIMLGKIEGKRRRGRQLTDDVENRSEWRSFVYRPFGNFVCQTQIQIVWVPSMSRSLMMDVCVRCYDGSTFLIVGSVP